MLYKNIPFNKKTQTRLLLSDALPAFATERRQLFNEKGKPELSA